MPWFVAPERDGRFAGQHARRAPGCPAAEAPDGVDELEAGADARARRRPRGPSGVPQTAITASPMNFSTRAAVALDHLARDLEVARQRVADVLGVAFLGERREADEVGEQDRDEPALGDGEATRAFGWRRGAAPRRGRAWRPTRSRSRHRSACPAG